MKLLTTFPILAISVALFSCNGQRKATAEEPPPPPPPTVPAIETPPATVTFGGTTPADSLFLSLERTACFGACKTYRLQVYRSGFATYDGRANVEPLGAHTARIDTATLNALLDKANAMGFFGMRDKYDGEVTDLPSTFLRIAANGQNKQVMGRVGQPAAFKALVAYCEEQLLPQAWKPVPAER